MKRPTVVGLLALCGACSVLYDPNNLGAGRVDAPGADATDAGVIDTVIDSSIDAPFDAPIDAAIDAPPGPLTVTSITAPTLHEGTGIGSRPALVIVNVTGLTTSAPILTLAPIMDGTTPRTATLAASQVSGDRSKIALAIALPVLEMVGHNVTRPLRLTIEQAGAMVDTDLTVTGLDELAPTTATVDASTLRSLYSRATFASAVRFTGTAPALIRTTSNISITAVVNVDGVGSEPGAHGCAGGAASTVGSCGASGGGGGNSGLGGSAGGGGGFGAAGATGMGNTPGGGGAASGDDLLISLTTNIGAAGNRGNGGGGGGGATLGGGGAGGGGGGVLELTAGGSITVTGAGRATANGGTGAPGGGLGGGNGGGGSGGALVVRSGNGITAPAGWVIANGGLGAGSSNKGGNGSIGRVRIDSTTSIAGMVTGPIPRQGAVWATDAPTIVTSLPVSIRLAGAVGQTYGVTLNDVAQLPASVGSAGTATLMPNLAVGTNTLCALASTTATLANLESLRCIDVVYLP